MPTQPQIILVFKFNVKTVIIGLVQQSKSIYLIGVL